MITRISRVFSLVSLLLLCFQAGFSQLVDLDWATQFEGNNDHLVMDIAVDDSGNVYTVGVIDGPTDFDPGPGTYILSGSFGEGFICKQDSNGHLLWATTLGGGGSTYGFGAVHRIAVGDSGVFVTGHYDTSQNMGDSMDIDPGPGVRIVRSQGGFVSRFNPGGTMQWLITIKSSYHNLNDPPFALSLDDTCNLYITGDYTNNYDFDPGPGLDTLGTSGIFLWKLTAGGQLGWVQSVPRLVEGLDVQGNGTSVITGISYGTVDFDPGPAVANLTGLSNYACKFNAAGDFEWVRGFNCNWPDAGGVTFDHSGNVICTGQYADSLDADPGTGTHMLYTTTYPEGLYTVKLDGTGNFLWANNMPNGAPQAIAEAVTANQQDEIYIHGSYYHWMDLDPGPDTLVIPNGTGFLTTAFLQKLDANGQLIYAMANTASLYNKGLSIEVNNLGSVYAMGWFQDSVDFDPDTNNAVHLVSLQQADIFVQKLDECYDFTHLTIVACDSFTAPSGNHTWTVTGNYVDSLINAHGCDSLLYINLTIEGGAYVQDTQLVCGSYTWPPTGLTYTQSGIYVDSTTTVLGGCDSVNVLHLTVANERDTVVIDSCDSYTWALNGQTYTSSAVDSVLYTNALNCDSLIVLNLTIRHSTSDTQHVVACSSYTWTVTGQTYTVEGMYAGLMANAAGCDSLITLDLKLEEYRDTLTVTACDEYTWPLNGQTYVTTTMDSITLTNAAGCDSVVVLDLAIYFSFTDTLTVTVCDTFYWGAGEQTYSSTGLYPVVFTDARGCDSTWVLDLQVDTVDTAVSLIQNQLVAQANNALYQWLDCNDALAPVAGANDSVFTPPMGGSFALQITQLGCIDTTNCFDVGGLGVDVMPLERQISAYPNPTRNLVTVDLGETFPQVHWVLRNALGQAVASKTVGGGPTFQLEIPGPAGLYLLEVVTNSGSRATLHLLKN